MDGSLAINGSVNYFS